MSWQIDFFLQCAKLRGTATSDILKVLDRWYLEVEYPRMIISENGPQLRTEFNDYCKEKGIYHEPSSPHNPRSNSLTELSVKVANHFAKSMTTFKDVYCLEEK